MARASLDELAGERGLHLDPFTAVGDTDHEYGMYILAMRERCRKWLESEDPLTAANSILISIRRAAALLKGQMDRTASEFLEEGGFTERLSRARIEHRSAKAREQAENMPRCPKCGRELRKVVARKGRNAGREFWGCSGYPDCDFTRNV